MKEQWNAYLELTNATLDRWLSARRDLPEPFLEVLRYSVLGGGKRIRPILALAACEAAGGDPAWALPPACALELIHAYSLVHDDLPSMDDDDVRRGQPTVHKKWGVATAILAGDGLQSEAFYQLAHPRNWSHEVSAESRMRIFFEVAQAAGNSGMVGGQYIDVAARDAPLDREGLETLHRLKTGALIHAAAVTGGIAAGAGILEQTALSQYGSAVGRLFQLTDDLIDHREDVAAGREMSEEEAAVNFIALLGADAVEAEVHALLDEALEAAAVLGDPHNTFLIDYARNIARRTT